MKNNAENRSRNASNARKNEKKPLRTTKTKFYIAA